MVQDRPQGVHNQVEREIDELKKQVTKERA